jgi:hypothetical protein
MTSTTSHSTVPPPTIDDFRLTLRRSFGDDFNSVWEKMCASAGIPPDARSLDDQQADRLLDVIAAKDRLCHVISMSWRIRLTAARKLAELGR